MRDLGPPAAVQPADRALTDRDRHELRDAEATLTHASQSYAAQGRCLKRIHERRLYRERYASFEDYCQSRWDIGRNAAYTAMACADAVSQLVDRGVADPDLPRNVSQCRELLRLRDPDERADAWRSVLAECGDRITHDAVRHAVNRLVLDAADAGDPGSAPPAPDAAGPVVEDRVVRGTEPRREMSPPGDAVEVDRVAHLRDMLPEELHAGLDAQVTLWDRIDAAVRGYRMVARKALQDYEKAGGAPKGLAYEIRRHVTLEPPDQWQPCQAPESGGCGGRGEVPGVGRCLKCGGLGFRMRYRVK